MEASAGGASESRSTAEVSARENRAAGRALGAAGRLARRGQGSHTAHRVPERLVVVVGHGLFTVRSPSGV
jgi:hypothetical protein